MSVRNLEHLFRPRSVAVIGATDRPGSIGSLVMHNLLSAGFEGPVWPVNPKHPTVAGLQAWPDVDTLPEVPELAVICTPAATVPGLVQALGRRGTRAAVVLTAGLKARERPDGPTLEQQMLEAARPYLLRVLGPNCLGLLVPGVRLNASFAHTHALPGRLAFVSQSGALATALLDWANSRGIGFSHFVSLGDSADVDVGDVLDWLASDPATRAILLYLESVQAARKFMSAARAAARNKPVLVVKSGRAPEGARAAASHTGALAASDLVVDAAIRRAGMLRVLTLQELFDAAETLARARPLAGERLAVLTNGGGAGVLAADALALAGGRLAPLAPETLAALDRALPATWSHGNPVDIIGDAPVARYTAALEALLAADEVDAVLLMHAPTAVVPSAEIARACLPLVQQARKPVLTCWLGGDVVEPARQLCATAGVPTYDTPERAVTAFLQMVEYRRNQDSLLQTPPALPEAPRRDVARAADAASAEEAAAPRAGYTAGADDRAAARAMLQRAQAEGREMLSELEAKVVLEAYGIPAVPTRLARDPDEAACCAESLGFPAVLKILSHDISHKSDVGGVVLGLQDAAQVREAARAMIERIARVRPGARLAGFTVQPQVRRPMARELIVGVSQDPVFGPVILFGQGGTAVELLADRAIALPPLNMALARELVSRTQVAKLLGAWRDHPAVDEQALNAVLVRVSHLVCDLDELAELDINPLLADEAGVIALDARMRVRAGQPPVASRLAIRPYPKELESLHPVDGQQVLVRPIRPEDESRLRDFYASARPEDVRLRFFGPRREWAHSELARYSQIDYDREMCLVALPVEAEGRPSPQAPLLGEVRALCDPDNREAEFAIQVRSDWQQRGLGRLLLALLADHLRRRGTERLVGMCLRENVGMARLARSLGFEVRDAGGGVMALRLELGSGGNLPAGSAAQELPSSLS